MSKKNLDKLFQEKFKDFREIPDERVWDSIEQSLDKRQKRRRVIPIWWKLGGVAAVLAIALLIINPFGTNEAPESIISDVESSESPAQTEVESDRPLNNEYQVTDSDNTSTGEESQIVESQGTQQEEDTEQDPSGLANTRKRAEQKEGKSFDLNKAQRENNVVTTKSIDPETPEIVSDQIYSNKDQVVVSTQDENEKNKIERQTDPAVVDVPVVKDQIKKEDIVGETEAQIAEKAEESESEDASGKKSIFDEIEKQQEEDALVEKTEGSKWSVGPSVAPVYFNSFGEGSPIHSSFASNSKSGNVNLSYGVGVSYDISKKLKIRSGIHKVDYGYDTNDITFSSSLVASTSTVITNIDYTTTSRTLVVESSNRPETTQEFAANDIVAQSPSRNGRMVQEFGYIEVPMELNYALLDRKLNIDIIGGFSSLFLVNNSVTLESEGNATEMGEANNLNDVNFSTNVGLGINYELTDKMKVHLEPMFKYQMNTFSDTEGSFQPYSVGVYTGLSFKF